MADSREEIRDLTMTMKSLEIQNIQLNKKMEDMERKTAIGNLTELKADTRKEVYNLKLAIKNLETQNTQQKIKMEGLARKMAFEMKSLEIPMDQVKANPGCVGWGATDVTPGADRGFAVKGGATLRNNVTPGVDRGFVVKRGCDSKE